MLRPIFFSALLLVSQSAWGIINIEALRNKPFEGTKGKASLGFSGKSGNSETTDYQLETMVYSKSQAYENLAILTYKYGESRDVKDEDKTTAHFRHGRPIKEYLSWEAFAQFEKDQFTRLSFRGLLGGGIRYGVYNTDKAQIHVGLGGFVSEENLEKKTGTDDHGSNQVNRGNLYLSFYVPLSNGASWSNVTYFQPNFDRMTDHRVFEKMNLDVKINKSISIGIYLQVAHDNEPPQLVKTTDSQYGTKFSYSF